MKMSLGEKAILFISSDYITRAGTGPFCQMPTLFEAELLKIERANVRDSRRHDQYEAVAKQMLGQGGTTRALKRKGAIKRRAALGPEKMDPAITSLCVLCDLACRVNCTVQL